MSTPTTPKAMSNRLLTMKFMQRAASSPSSTPTTPDTTENPSKKRKISKQSTTQPSVDSLVDRTKIQAAIAEDERKREEALVKHAAQVGDAHWVLDVQEKAADSAPPVQAPLNIVRVGFTQIDSYAPEHDGDSIEDSTLLARAVRRYNMDKKKEKKREESDSDESSSESSSNSDSDSDSDSSSEEQGPGRQLHGQNPREEGRRVVPAKRRAEKANAKEFADKRRKKEVKLNKSRGPPLKSISSGGASLSLSSGGSRKTSTFACHRCGKPGHKAADCKSQR
ncbi:hypothetical protein F4778DRAFT_175140 [Xylariomycetidae sp. FL2044]|nr:hypothetical protein F4778DRAFT_175140 [Xylariomycetidae sp. FL2044]